LNYGGERDSLFAQHSHGIFQALKGERKHAVADQLLNDADISSDRQFNFLRKLLDAHAFYF
jgi:hypothetical protein